MKRLICILFAALMLSVLTACQKSGNEPPSGSAHNNSDSCSAESGLIYETIELPDGGTTVIVTFDMPEPDFEAHPPLGGIKGLDEQEAKYGGMLPLEYDDRTDGGIYGIMTDDGMMISYDDYPAAGGGRTYVDNNGERHFSFSYLATDGAEIVFEDGTPADADDLAPGTAVLVQYDSILESYPATIRCTKITVLN